MRIKIRNEEIELKKITVFIGDNGVGKSHAAHEIARVASAVFIPQNRCASSGTSDAESIRRVIDHVSEGIIVIDNIELSKSPITLVSLIRYIVDKVATNNVSVVITTSSDLTVKALAKAVEEGKIRSDDVAVYYLEPQTIKQIKIYEDGSIDELPTSEKVLKLLF